MNSKAQKFLCYIESNNFYKIAFILLATNTDLSHVIPYNENKIIRWTSKQHTKGNKQTQWADWISMIHTWQ